MKRFNVILFSIAVVLQMFLFGGLASAQQDAMQSTIPLDLRKGFDSLKQRMAAYKTASNLFYETYKADSSRLSFDINQLNGIKAGAIDAAFQRSEKYTALTADFSNLASDVLGSLEKTLTAEQRVDDQIETLLQKTRNGPENKSTASIFSVASLVEQNENQAENYEIAREALSGDVNPSTAASMDREFNKQLASRAAALQSAASTMAFMKQLLKAGGMSADSSFGNLHAELIRLRSTLRAEKENQAIMLRPFILWSTRVGPTLVLRETLSRIVADNQQLRFPSLPSIDIQSVPEQDNQQILETMGITSPVASTSGGTDYLKRAKEALEKRRVITNNNGGVK